MPGAAIVGTLEQVGIAAVLSVPLGILTATYLADSRSLSARIVSYVVDAMTGAPAIIAGLFIYCSGSHRGPTTESPALPPGWRWR